MHDTVRLWHYAGWMAFSCFVIIDIGFDLKGIVGDRTSEAEAVTHTLGIETLGHLFRAKGVRNGIITQDKSMCINCNTCRMVCPMGIFGIEKIRGMSSLLMNQPV